jgi:Methylamine utilisation protein MauE
MDPALDLTFRAGLALLFASAALHKLRDPRGFMATLADYRLLPARLAAAAGLALMGTELAVVAALVIARRAGLAGTAALLLLYAGAMAINLARGRRHIDCGCTGPAARRAISGRLVTRNVALAGLALAALAPVAQRGLLWIDGVTIAAATVALAACWAAMDRLLALEPGLARLRESM